VSPLASLCISCIRHSFITTRKLRKNVQPNDETNTRRTTGIVQFDSRKASKQDLTATSKHSLADIPSTTNTAIFASQNYPPISTTVSMHIEG
jgi:hypothetical protein